MHHQNLGPSYEAIMLIIPEKSNYMAETQCTVFHFPASLKDVWVNFSSPNFVNALNHVHGRSKKSTKSFTIGGGRGSLLKMGTMLGMPTQLMPEKKKATMMREGTLSKGTLD